LTEVTSWRIVAFRQEISTDRIGGKVMSEAGKGSRKNGTAKLNISSKKAPAKTSRGLFPIVGIGASAGGLAAFEAFFSGMPVDSDPDMAFVLVQHLAPDHKSILTDLIRRYTRMQVFEVEDGMAVRPNCAYIIPPGCDMAFFNGVLQLLAPVAPRGQRLPIDFFFRSLAQDQHERAICIVLSGTGSDGTLGLRAIKGEGGMVMAQNPASSEFDGMPRSALSTGLVDYELPPAEMAAQLVAYVAHAFGKPFSLPTPLPTPKQESSLKKIFLLLRSQTNNDFSQYKPSTINRRIDRRMAINQIDSLESYVNYLQHTPAEVESLFRDLLIGVTNFFRDTEAFKVLEETVIPAIFTGKPTGSIIRVWTPGCSTGEEAYSIAILLQERIEALMQHYTLQIFATDIDSLAISTARAGLYPSSIADDLTPERLARFFVSEPDGYTYRIHKNIRDTVVFSEQNVITDPPFSKLDLISCRNLLIYMGGDLQKKIIPLFHYALNPGGILFLGTSETVGEFGEIFTVLDRKAKFYQRREDFPGSKPMFISSFISPLTTIHTTPPQAASKSILPVKLPLRELTEQALLQKVTPAGALVNSQGEILYMHGRTGLYLELATGEVGLPNILKMAREGLRLELANALHKAVMSKESVHRAGLRVITNNHFCFVNLSIHQITTDPAATPGTSLYLIVLEEAPQPDPVDPLQASEKSDLSEDINAHIISLKQELRAKEEYLQTANEELETSNEELKSSNEEMQSVNEELQSTNEELETSKEELQSVNEELATVNGELQTKVADLSRANNDMNNLLAGTGIGTVFVDLHLRILRFTPTASAIINLIPSDLGRPVGHLVSNLLDYNSMVADTQRVVDTLIPKEIEVQTTNGMWYTMRIQPYRTIDNTIEGAVITFVDITEMKKTAAALQESEWMLRNSQAVAHIGAYITSLTATEFDTNTWQASSEIYNIFGVDNTYPHTLAAWFGFIHPDSREEFFAYHKQVVGERKRFDHQYKIVRINDGEERWVQGTGEIEYDGKSNPVRMIGTIQDITERKQAEETLRKANEVLRLAVVVRDAHDAITVQNLDGRIIAWNPGAVRMYGWSEYEALEMNVRDRIPEELRNESLVRVHQLSQATVLEPYHTLRISRDGTVVEVIIIATALVNETGQMYAIATTERSVNAQTSGG
jgi:two-component system CheB/CheR fusion protein